MVPLTPSMIGIAYPYADKASCRCFCSSSFSFSLSSYTVSEQQPASATHTFLALPSGSYGHSCAIVACCIYRSHSTVDISTTITSGLSLFLVCSSSSSVATFFYRSAAAAYDPFLCRFLVYGLYMDFVHDLQTAYSGILGY